jgi:DNA-binding GntR family transcriptional regulator
VNPRVERPRPPYLQIVEHYRQRIKNGDLADGDRMPTVREIADEADVAFTTAARAMRVLAAEGLVATSTQGTRVAFAETSTFTPRDRLNAMRRSGRIYPPSERADILAAELVPPPPHVAEAMAGEDGPPETVVRRVRVTYHSDRPVTVSTSWMPGDLAGPVPELVSTARIPGGTVGAVFERTGRAVVRDTYRECARRATHREADLLGVTTGDPVLHGQNTWYDNDGAVLEFGEYVIPEGRWVTVEDD